VQLQRIWRSSPRRIKRAARGYTAQFDGRQARCCREDWPKDDAEKALAARLLGVTPQGAPAPVAGMS
jgi:hypothetical protein